MAHASFVRCGKLQNKQCLTLDIWIYIDVYICRCGKWQYITVCCALYVCLLQNFNQFLYLACERPFHSRYVTSKWTEKRFGLEMRFDTNNFIILCSRFPHPFSSLNNYVSMKFQKKKTTPKHDYLIENCKWNCDSLQHPKPLICIKLLYYTRFIGIRCMFIENKNNIKKRDFGGRRYLLP